MKKFLYYIMPFIVTPALMTVCSVFDRWQLFSMSIYIWGAVFIIASAVFGFFTSTNKKFDYLMTFIMPLSFFLSMFSFVFFCATEQGRCNNLEDAVLISLQPFALISYCLMAIATFIASYKGFRNFKNRITQNIKTDGGKIKTFKISSITATVLGSAIVILTIVITIISALIYSKENGNIPIIGGADEQTVFHALRFSLFENAFYRIVFGMTLLLIGLLGLIFRKTIFANCTKKSSLLTLSTSFFGGLGFASLLFWFVTVTSNRIKFSPIGYPTSIVVGFLSLFAVIISIVLYVREQKKDLKIKGIIIEVSATIITFPCFVIICSTIARLI